MRSFTKKTGVNRERRVMMDVIAGKSVNRVLCEKGLRRSEKLEEASFYNYNSKGAFYI